VKKRIAIIGCGKMGEALLKGLVYQRPFLKSCIFVADKDRSRLSFVKKKYCINTSTSNADACIKADIIILAVKPQDMGRMLKEISGIAIGKLIISVAAGTTIDFIKRNTKAKNIVRAMPNTPAIVGCAMTALAYSRGMKKTDKKEAERIFGCIGEFIVLDERYMDAVTAVSGSGPAYLFLLMEAMAKAAISLGFKKDTAYMLVSQTISGASLLQQRLKKCPASLRKDVTSRGGTTEAALKVLKEKGFEKMIKQAVTAACKKSKSLKAVS
jgi:pyrroline-5-carboxylate reductase